MSPLMSINTGHNQFLFLSNAAVETISGFDVNNGDASKTQT